MDLIAGPSQRRIAGLGRGAVLAAGLAVFLATGCFSSSTFQGSSESSSKSSGSFSDSSGSISRSSSGGDDQSAYHRDVRDSAASVAATQADAAPADAAQLEREIGVVAGQHDVLDWERDDETYREIGRGLSDAGVAPERFDVLAAQLSHGDARRRALIEEGFQVEATR